MVLTVNHREVIEGCQRGEDEAFRVLFETYKDKVYSIALRYSGNSATAMDISQDNVFEAFGRISTSSAAIRVSSPGCTGW